MPEESYSSSSSPNGFCASAPGRMTIINIVSQHMELPPLLEGLALGLDANGFPSPALSPLSGLPKGFEGEPKGLAGWMSSLLHM